MRLPVCLRRAIWPVALLLCACSSGPQTLYYWGNYQPQVYERLKREGKGPAEQIIALEDTAQRARARGQQLPPGFHAHLGMLYAETGKADQVVQQFETEKALFPESASFMDFLLTRVRGEAKP